jgi:putative sensor protein
MLFLPKEAKMNTKISTAALPAAGPREVDRGGAEALAPGAIREASLRASPLAEIFGVYWDPRTWRSALYILISLVTGILYFTWAVTGLALSASFLILIIGLPFGLLFLASVRGLSLFEGRLVEVILGVPVKRTPMFAEPGLTWWKRLKALVTDKLTWRSMVYMILQLPLGIIYFTMTVTLGAVALGLMAAPIVDGIRYMPLVMLLASKYHFTVWILVLMEIGGFTLLTLTLHLVRTIGRWHAQHAQGLLGR